mgnify:CR=1 FL=1
MKVTVEHAGNLQFRSFKLQLTICIRNNLGMG